MRKEGLNSIFAVLALAGWVSGGTVRAEVPPPRISVQDCHAGDYGTSGSQSAITAALAVIGSEKRTLVLEPATWAITANLTIPANVVLNPKCGAMLAIASGTILTINGSLNAGTYQVFSSTGTGKVAFGPSSVREVLVDWFGATRDGSTDSAAAVNQAIASLPVAPPGSPLAIDLVFSAGKYQINSALTPFGVFNQNTVRGESETSTRIDFCPTAPAVTLFVFDGTGNRPTGNGLRDMTIYGRGKQTKTLVSIIEQSYFTMQHVQLNNAVETDHDSSIGLEVAGSTWGLEASSFSDLAIFVPRPMIIKNLSNPPKGSGLDHCRFSNLYLLSRGGRYPNIEVLDGCNLSNITFDGYQAWVSGNGGFVWINAQPTGNGINIAFNNVRIESGGMEHTKNGFHIEGYAQVRNLRFTNCYIGLNPAKLTGIYLRHCREVTLGNVYVDNGSGVGTSYDIDDTCDKVLVLNLSSNTGCTPRVEMLTQLFGSGVCDSPESEDISFYVNSANRSEASRYFSIMENRVWTSNGDIADGAMLKIPSFSASINQIFVAFSEGTGAAGGGHFLVTPSTAGGTALKISGTANCAGTSNTTGTVNVSRSPEDSTIKVINNIGETRRVSVIVYYN